jgi:hypothetical protein
VILHRGYIEKAFFLGIPKWEFQNWDSYSFETLDVHIFVKSIFFGAYEGNFLHL